MGWWPSAGTSEPNRYLSPAGAREYIEADGDFERAGIEVVYQDIDHNNLLYPQQSRYGDCITHLSTRQPAGQPRP